MKKIIIILIFLLGCENEYKNNNLETWIHLYSELPYENGIYTFDYPEGDESSYFKVSFNSLPYQRVYWDSPDTFRVIMWQDTTWVPVVKNSTYADENGLGHQMVYVNPTLIGDTLNVIGTINNILYVPVLQEEILIKIQ